MKKCDWLFRGLRRIVEASIFVSLIKFLIPRFIDGGLTVLLYWEVTLPSSLVFLIASSDLTRTGKNLEEILNRIGIPSHYQQVSRLALVILLLIFQVGYSNCYLPKVSEHIIEEFIDREGKDEGFPDTTSDLEEVKKKSKKAIALNPNNHHAYFFLGNYYEESIENDINKAIKKYLKSMKLGNYYAPTNLTRLYIKKLEKGEINENENIFFVAIKELRKWEEKLTSKTPESREKCSIPSFESNKVDEKKYIFALAYSVYKNLGWLELKNNLESVEIYNDLYNAEMYLEIAICFAEKYHELYKKELYNHGSAYCLIAQVYESMAHKFKREGENKLENDAKEKSNINWCECHKKTDLLNIPEEDKWGRRAQKMDLRNCHVKLLETRPWKSCTARL